jgi:hypothetical protein
LPHASKNLAEDLPAERQRPDSKELEGYRSDLLPALLVLVPLGLRLADAWRLVSTQLPPSCPHLEMVVAIQYRSSEGARMALGMSGISLSLRVIREMLQSYSELFRQKNPTRSGGLPDRVTPGFPSPWKDDINEQTKLRNKPMGLRSAALQGC